METFELRKEHIALLSNMLVKWDESLIHGIGAPMIDQKRPYGNSSILDDMARILKWKTPGNLSESQEDALIIIHRETSIALQIVLCTKSFKTGKYVKTEPYDDTSWKLKSKHNNK